MSRSDVFAFQSSSRLLTSVSTYQTMIDNKKVQTQMSKFCLVCPHHSPPRSCVGKYIFPLKSYTEIKQKTPNSLQNSFAADASQAILNQILLPEAADRLGRIRLVKEERATDIEKRLIMLARTGQLQAKVTEEQLKELLNAVAENKKEEKIVINRRKDGWDNDDDDLSDLRRGF